MTNQPEVAEEKLWEEQQAAWSAQRREQLKAQVEVCRLLLDQAGATAQSRVGEVLLRQAEAAAMAAELLKDTMKELGDLKP